MQDPVIHIMNRASNPADAAVWMMRCGFVVVVGAPTPEVDFVGDDRLTIAPGGRVYNTDVYGNIDYVTCPGCIQQARDNTRRFDGIDRSVSPETLCSLKGPTRPLDEETIREGFRLMREVSERERQRGPVDLLPAGLFEIVRDHGWGAEALAWVEKNRGAPR